MRKGKPAQLRIRLRRRRWLIPAQGWHNPGIHVQTIKTNSEGVARPPNRVRRYSGVPTPATQLFQSCFDQVRLDIPGLLTTPRWSWPTLQRNYLAQEFSARQFRGSDAPTKLPSFNR